MTEIPSNFSAREWMAGLTMQALMLKSQTPPPAELVATTTAEYVAAVELAISEIKGPAGVIYGAPVALGHCPPGLFLFNKTYGFKSAYGNNDGRIEAYLLSSGEFFWGGTTTGKAQRQLIVRPIFLTLVENPEV